MYFIVNCDNAYYLMYFSVIDTLRNKKYGSKILQDLKEKYGTLFLSIEQPVDELSIRRKNFYLKNGFFETNKIYTDTEVCYEILCTNSNYIITNDTMIKRYKNDEIFARFRKHECSAHSPSPRSGKKTP